MECGGAKPVGCGDARLRGYGKTGFKLRGRGRWSRLTGPRGRRQGYGDEKGAKTKGDRRSSAGSGEGSFVEGLAEGIGSSLILN